LEGFNIKCVGQKSFTLNWNAWLCSQSFDMGNLSLSFSRNLESVVVMVVIFNDAATVDNYN